MSHSGSGFDRIAAEQFLSQSRSLFLREAGRWLLNFDDPADVLLLLSGEVGQHLGPWDCFRHCALLGLHHSPAVKDLAFDVLSEIPNIGQGPPIAPALAVAWAVKAFPPDQASTALRAPENMSRSNLVAEAPGWQDANEHRSEIPGWIRHEERSEQRRQPGWIGCENDRLIFSGALSEAAPHAAQIFEQLLDSGGDANVPPALLAAAALSLCGPAGIVPNPKQAEVAASQLEETLESEAGRMVAVPIWEGAMLGGHSLAKNAEKAVANAQAKDGGSLALSEHALLRGFSTLRAMALDGYQERQRIGRLSDRRGEG